jgi:hypothetical protein
MNSLDALFDVTFIFFGLTFCFYFWSAWFDQRRKK